MTGDLTDPAGSDPAAGKRGPLPRELWARPVEDMTPQPGRWAAATWAVQGGSVAGAVLGAGVGTTIVPLWGTVVGGLLGGTVGAVLGVGNGIALAALPRAIGTRVGAALVSATTSALGGAGLAYALRSPEWDLVPPLAFGGLCALVGAGVGAGTPLGRDRRRGPRRT
jgi:hypothetical protein